MESNFRLQGVDHFIDHTYRQMRGYGLADKLRRQVDRDDLARLIAFFIGSDRDIDLWHAHLDARVMEAVITAFSVQHRERQVG